MATALGTSLQDGKVQTYEKPSHVEHRPSACCEYELLT